jgi:biotin carboxyl carrier protein
MDSRHVLVERNGKRIVLAIMRSSQGYDVLSRGIPMEVQVEASAAPSTNSSRRSNHISVGGEIRAPMPAQVKSIAVVQGDTVEEGQLLVVLETMKMENDVRADRPGTVGKVEVHPGLIVEKDQLLMTIE